MLLLKKLPVPGHPIIAENRLTAHCSVFTGAFPVVVVAQMYHQIRVETQPSLRSYEAARRANRRILGVVDNRRFCNLNPLKPGPWIGLLAMVETRQDRLLRNSEGHILPRKLQLGTRPPLARDASACVPSAAGAHRGAGLLQRNNGTAQEANPAVGITHEFAPCVSNRST